MPWGTQPRQDEAFHFPTQGKTLWTHQHLGTTLIRPFSFYLPISHAFSICLVSFGLLNNFHQCVSPLTSSHLNSKPIHKTPATALKSGGSDIHSSTSFLFASRLLWELSEAKLGRKKKKSCLLLQFLLFILFTSVCSAYSKNSYRQLVL